MSSEILIIYRTNDFITKKSNEIIADAQLSRKKRSLALICILIATIGIASTEKAVADMICPVGGNKPGDSSGSNHGHGGGHDVNHDGDPPVPGGAEGTVQPPAKNPAPEKPSK